MTRRDGFTVASRLVPVHSPLKAPGKFRRRKGEADHVEKILGARTIKSRAGRWQHRQDAQIAQPRGP